jgi:hypothetical protein
MQPIEPFWFKQRQCKAEPAGADHLLKVTGPNLGEAYIGIQLADNQRWRATLRTAPDQPDVAVTEAEHDTPRDAWNAAFELYRRHFIV